MANPINVGPSYRKSLLNMIDNIRGLTGPGAFALRLHQLTVVQRTWSGSKVRQGTSTDTVVASLAQQFRVRPVSQRDISGSGGQYMAGDVEVLNITPTDDMGTGYTVLQLKPKNTQNNVEIVYQLAGPQAGDYEEVELDTYRPFSWRLVLRRLRSTP